MTLDKALNLTLPICKWGQQVLLQPRWLTVPTALGGSCSWTMTLAPQPTAVAQAFPGRADTSPVPSPRSPPLDYRVGMVRLCMLQSGKPRLREKAPTRTHPVTHVGVELGSALSGEGLGREFPALLGPRMCPQEASTAGRRGLARTRGMALSLGEGSGWKRPQKGRKQAQQGLGDGQG